MSEPSLSRREALSILVAAPFISHVNVFDTITAEQYLLTEESIREFVAATIPHYSRNRWVDVSLDFLEQMTSIEIEGGNPDA